VRRKEAEKGKKGKKEMIEYIAIEGSIGVGKTTVVERLTKLLTENNGDVDNVDTNMKKTKKRKKVQAVLPEPVEEWSDVLKQFYADPARFSTHLQMDILLARTKQLFSCEEGKGRIIVERSVDSSSNVFVPMLVDDGFMNAQDVRMYTSWDELVQKQVLSHLSLGGVIYIQASPETCLRRISKRSRDGEAGIALDYLRKLQDSYARWLADIEKKGVPVIRICMEDDGEQAVENAVRKILDSVLFHL